MNYVYPDRNQVVGMINHKVDDTHLIMTTVDAPDPDSDIQGLCVLCEDGLTLAEVLSAVTHLWSNIGFEISQTMGAYYVVFFVAKDEKKSELSDDEKSVSGPTEIKGTYEVIFRRFGGEPIKRYRVYAPRESWAVFHALKMMHQDGVTEFPDGYITEYISQARIL